MRAKRIDANQPAAVDYLRSVGWRVFIASDFGRGFPDLVCARGRFTALVEIKDGSKPPSERKLTKPEQEFHDTWPGVCIVAISGEDAHKQLLRALDQ